MSGFAIESTAKWVGKLLVEEVQYLAKVRDKVEELQSELEWMQCFLLDADLKAVQECYYSQVDFRHKRFGSRS